MLKHIFLIFVIVMCSFSASSHAVSASPTPPAVIQNAQLRITSYGVFIVLSEKGNQTLLLVSSDDVTTFLAWWGTAPLHGIVQTDGSYKIVGLEDGVEFILKEGSVREDGVYWFLQLSGWQGYWITKVEGAQVILSPGNSSSKSEEWTLDSITDSDLSLWQPGNFVINVDVQAVSNRGDVQPVGNLLFRFDSAAEAVEWLYSGYPLTTGFWAHLIISDPL